MSWHEAPGTEDFLDRSRWPADPWRLIETHPDQSDLGVAETLFSVANGYLGMRGNVTEGRDSHTHGTFVNGFHETWPIHHAEEAFGFARVGQTIVNAPDAKVIRLYVDDEPLLISVADLLEYERSLDFRSGVLRREILWRTPSNKLVRVVATRMVSFAQRHLAVLEFEVTMVDSAAPIALSSQILNRQDGEDEYHVRSKAMGEGHDPRKSEGFDRRVLEPKYSWGDADEARVVLGFRCYDSGMTLAVAADHVLVTENHSDTRVQVEDDLAKVTYRIAAEPGVPIRLTKMVAYHTSRGVPVRELVDRCRRTLDRAFEQGVQKQYDDQRAWLEDFWRRSDVEVPGHPEVQQAIRWNLFQVAQASGRAEGAGIPAKGLTGSGYSGHYFWDTEVYVLPFLTYTNPDHARNALKFRYSLLDAGRKRAREMSQSGALFPWRTINGEEASAFFAAGTAQYHIDADIAYAVAQYYLATSDENFMFRQGIDILVETARMWVDLGFWRDEEVGTFHIHGVTGPDEYTTVVNDNLFTNVMARFNLAAAAQAVELISQRDTAAYDRMVIRLGLKDHEPGDWRRAAHNMAIPFDEALGVHPQDQHFLEREVWDLDHTPLEKRPLLLHYHPLVIYRFQVIKQADIVLALYLQGNHFTNEQKRANFEYYDPITTGDSTLSAVVQSIIAAEVGYRDLAYRYFLGALFVDLADRHKNATDGVHVASTGGIWSVLACGFGGFRDHRGDFTIDPRLPEAWDELIYRVTIQGSRVRVTVRERELELFIEDQQPNGLGDLVDPVFSVRGRTIKVSPGAPTVVPLDGQGPRIHGTPQPVAGRRRADGTVITAIVPGS
ncbi:glycoside hydrolase family 65 protein [Aeromicrobium duanguangcaii]|uniref:glycoside hydrolase family 65 protein n=1 Tax=Aeromicrobium duanguangcaii TaxID=2968086 RepID=UPI002017F079|nr:glycoside hydrolase family 65 protein [Aeromicrobium duanguangcaii]